MVILMILYRQSRSLILMTFSVLIYGLIGWGLIVIFDAWIVVCSVKNIGIILIFGEKRMDFCNIHYCRNFTDFLEGYALVSEMMLGVGVIRGCSRYDGKVALIIHQQIDRVIGGCVVVFNMYVFTKMIEVKLGEGIAAI